MRMLWRRRRSDCGEDTGARRAVMADAEKRLQAVEGKAAAASRTILARHARNHWSETIAAAARALTEETR